MSSCIFCSIIAKKIPAKLVREEKDWVAFHDINPQAPTHILIIPKKHIDKIDDLSQADLPIAGVLIGAAKEIAREQKIQNGYRLVFNNGAEAGQSVFHVHLHLLGGRPMSWPPG